ncbi:MAG: UDP-N-acetylmuramoyl-tripeptide--D-alanyl-D-alanine ligase [Alphaproteobacteria bacterium MarineAlpha10_Bin3]|nr:MAG: UDP-N-acetylmuramoyl-tripeptide--D-alanyl-D-alanine ligase [Alphaproteobacteria bacterium MarineAlpha10_Bin3]PPR67563.1 MAG: UDP-N-acetylmuramoyl-tripeptide--D-alanyl-D-alanine ligase [Alphaproteobacteria bacterium MarineAlpha4_Bin1]
MSALWTSSEAAAAPGGSNTAPWTASGVSIDSRTVQPGDLFIAIKGPNRDGHDHVADAIAKGAAAAMIEDAAGAVGAKAAAPLLRVNDTMAGMRGLAGRARARGRVKLAAVTGSAGKTGTKDALALVLGRQGATGSTQGNLNNHWGLPLSLARLGRDAQFGVFEMGMSSPGEIEPLSRLARPDVAVVTNVGAAHLEFFASEDDIADAKAEIFTGVVADGAAVLNRDCRHFERLRGHANAAGISHIRSFGAHEQADIRLIDADIQPDRSHVTARIGTRKVRYALGAPGAHWVANSLAVLAVVEALGADVDAAARALADVAPVPGRGARRTIRLDRGAFTLIDESYNASPASMRAALSVLGAAGGRRIAVLGDMLELGRQSPALHAALAADITANRVDLVFLAGRDMAHLAAALDPAVVAGQTRDAASILSLLRDAVRPGDTVMVKGSLGVNMAPVVAALIALEAESGANVLAASEG